MIRALSVAGGVLLSLGCARAKPASPVSHAPRSELPSDDGMRWLGVDVARARALGAGPPTVLAAGAGASGDNLGGRMRLPADACALFLARGSRAIEDLDLFVYGDDGAVLGEDETSTSTPGAVVCPPHPEYVYAFGRVAAGHGIFAVSAQIASPAQIERVERAIGTASENREREVAEGDWPGLDAEVARHHEKIGAGLREVRRIAVPLDPRVPARVTAEVEAHSCTDMLVVPADDVAYVDVAALDDRGRVIGRTPSDEEIPALLVCSEERTTVSFELRPRAGRGLSAVVLSTTKDPVSPGTVVLRLPSSTRPLAEAEAALSDALARTGYAPASFTERGDAVVGRSASLDLDLPEGCSRVDVIAGAPASGVDAWLWSSGGALSAHDTGGEQATLFPCIAHRARLDLEALEHAGPFAVEVRSLSLPSRPFSAHPLAASRLLGRFFEASRLSAPKDLGIPRTLSLSPDTLASDDVLVPPAHCLDVGLGLGPGAEGAEVRLLGEGGNQELARARGTHSAFTSTCALERSTPLRVRLEARVAVGTTTGLLGLRLRDEPPSAASLSAAPAPSAPVERAPAR